jgi:hypothetical protein
MVSMSALAALAALQPALAFDSGAFSAAGYAHGSMRTMFGDLRRGGAPGLRSQQPAVATLLPPAETAAATGAGPLDGSWLERRRVNWWFNIFDENTSAHVLQVARAHRTALTGVVQWVQPGGFTVHGDPNWCPPGTPAPCAGHVDLPPHAAMVSATRPLLELEVPIIGVVFSFLPPAVFLMPPGSPAIDRAVDQLAATAETYNLTSLMVDFEGYSNSTGPNGTAIPAFGCTEAKAGLLADFLRKLAVQLHAQGRRLGMSIEMGCIIGPEPYWKLYAGAGVDYMMSMASTYYGTNVSFNREWVQRELSAVPSSKLAVGMGVNPGGSQECIDIMKRGGSWGCPAWWGCPGAGQPNCTCPLGGAKGYNSTSLKFEAFARWVGESTPILELDLFRGDMVRANANPILDCVPPFAYEAMEQFLAVAPAKTDDDDDDDDDDNRLLAELGQDRRTEAAAAPVKLQTEFLPVGVKGLSLPCDRVRVSWQHNATAPNGTTQLSYDVTVMRDGEQSTLWSSGVVHSAEQQTAIGTTLQPATRYAWRVRATLSTGASGPSGWSDSSTFETAPALESWTEDTCNASWLGGGGQLRSSVDIPGQVKSARAYISGVGAFYLWINGKRVGDHVMDPAQSVYHQRMHYVTFDVADLLKSRSNQVVVALGNSKWGYIDTWCDMSRAGGPDGCRAMIFQLRMDMADGSRVTHCSSMNNGWQASDSPVTWDHLWHGESFNGSVPLGGDGEWRPARLMLNSSGGSIPSGLTTPPMDPIGPLFPTNSPPIRELERFSARSLRQLEVRQLCSGWVGPLPQIYTDVMCPNVGNHPGLGLPACEQQCARTPRCNAMTFSPGGAGCSLRSCARGAGMVPTGPKVPGSYAYHMKCPAPTSAVPSWHRAVVYDFGQNMLGRVTLRLPADHGIAAGTVIRLEHSELVQCDNWEIRPSPTPSNGSDHEAVVGSSGICQRGGGPLNSYCQAFGSRVNFTDLKTPGAPSFASSLRWEPCASAQIMGTPTASKDRVIGDFNDANQTNVYLVRGDGNAEEYTPLFAVSGFRYVTVSGVPAHFKPTLDLVEAGFVHSDVTPISTLTIADVAAEGNGSLRTPDVLGRMHRAYLYGQQSNLFSIPTGES